MHDMLTTKEASFIADLLTYEEQACKKARLYARCFTDQRLSQAMTQIAQNHERRFNALYKML